MKIAITADVHLKGKDETPERYKALENILQYLENNSIQYLIISGDVFDKDFSNYSDFDFLCKQFSSVNVIVIPGNHDYQINNRFFTASNVEIVNEIQVKELGGISALFVPYSTEKSIDESIAEYNHRNKLPERWILIGHGDYITGNRELNPYEPGFYMPLTSKSISRYNPLRVFLGHIHKPSDFGRVSYPGSPCGLDITETGRRRFLIYDTHLNFVDEVFVNNEKIYFDETIILLPSTEEELFLKRKINEMIKKWKVDENELKKIILRLSLKGYIRDVRSTIDTIVKILSSYGIKLYKEEIDLSKIKTIKEVDVDRLYLFEKTREKIERLAMNNFRTSKEKILEKAMELIF